MLRRFLAALVLTACLAAAAHATVPSTMSYQGVLTDNLGNLSPDGLYNFTFRIYTVGAGGSAIWTENDNNVQVTKGNFSVLLGNVTPLALAFDVPYYLGISVNGQAELAPRVQLASSAYGLSLRLPFAGTDTSSGPLFAIHNTGGGPDILTDHWLQVGSSATSGFVSVKGFGVSTDIASIYDYGIFAGAESPGGVLIGGGAISLYDKAGAQTFNIEPDVDGFGGGYMSINGNSAGSSFVVDGNNGTGSPTVTLNGPYPISFTSAVTGDASVNLPAGAIDAAEIRDEPGIAQAHTNQSQITILTTATDLASITITTPAAGYVVVTADGQHALTGNGSNPNYAHLYISETSGGAYDSGHYFDSGWSAGSPNLTQRTPVSIHRTYAKAAGTYTFYFQGQAVNTAALSNYMWNSTITATYYPTAYGGVSELVTASEASGLGRATPVGALSSTDQPAGTGSVVDLRELEQRIASEEQQLRDAETRLRQTRAQKQLLMDARRLEQARAASARRAGGER